MEYNYYEYPNYLYHHGIKGMKWGVRRFQKKDGSLTSEGKKRYSDDSSDNSSAKKNKVGHRQVLEKKYRDSGMSEIEAKAAADKRIKIEKAVAVTAGLTVAACAAYYAKNKYAETYCDQILKAGTSFHNLDSAANYRPGEHLYVNYRQNDTQYFRGHFAVNKMRKTGSVFNHTITATEDIKIPSLKTRKNVFKQLYDNDAEFREAFNTHAHGVKDAKNAKLTYKGMWPKFGDKDTPEFNVAKRKYFEALRQKGYEAIVDEWDTNKRVFRSDAPLILLNTSSKSFGEMSINELTKKDILLSQANSKWYQPVRSLKTAAKLPHTNHFKESSKRLAKEAAKNAKNKEAIDTITKHLSEDAMNKYVTKRQGSVLADAGRYMLKNDKLTAAQAITKANTKQNAQDTLQALGYLGLAAVPYTALIRTGQETYVKNYIEEHPNTRKSYSSIVRMYYDDMR